MLRLRARSVLPPPLRAARWVSASRDPRGYESYLASMPWPAAPFDPRRVEALRGAFGVKGFPTLVFVDAATGALISADGVNKARDARRATRARRAPSALVLALSLSRSRSHSRSRSRSRAPARSRSRRSPTQVRADPHALAAPYRSLGQKLTRVWRGVCRAASGARQLYEGMRGGSGAAAAAAA